MEKNVTLDELLMEYSTIDFESKNGADHEYVRTIGYEPEMKSDCSFTAVGLEGMNLSSYGDSGTLYGDWANEETKKVFEDMYFNGIITLYKGRKYEKHETIIEKLNDVRLIKEKQ